jgi:MYXO-CTERM domain-containing protein
MCQIVPSRSSVTVAGRLRCALALLATACCLWIAGARIAQACGCFSPPVPNPGAVDFAVNQHAEQIIFEVEPDGHLVAHVLIRYSGDPQKFAWIVPVPSVPELELSYAEAFGLIDQQTSPQVSVSSTSLCPSALYSCHYHPMPSCGPSATTTSPGSLAASSPAFAMGGAAGGVAPTAPEVTVYARQQVGSYDTVVFGAGDAAAAGDWLNTEGFIVNDSMNQYMQPYIDENMLFVAAKLIPGAGVDSIKPLRMRYLGTQPMIPLQLTAVATEPNLTVTAYIYGNSGFGPTDRMLLTSADIPADALSATGNRNNYPMVLARLFDEEGGQAFMLEYSSQPPRFKPVTFSTSPFVGGFQGPGGPGVPPGGVSGGQNDCCASADAGSDACRILNDGKCQCPLSQAEANDCASKPDLVAGVKLVEDLATKYPRMTRITTRLSAEEMTYDPTFGVDASVLTSPRLSLTANVETLPVACENDVIERDRYQQMKSIQGCATVYCGRGTCAASDAGVGCRCDPGFVARIYTDLDDSPSVTCVPNKAPVDLAAGGITIPDICDTLGSGRSGSCVNLAGFAGIHCADTEVAVPMGSGIAPQCQKVFKDSGNSGARDYSKPLEDIRICAPKPPACDAHYGWLAETGVKQRPSVERCDSSVPDPTWLVVPPLPTCPSTTSASGSAGSGATTTSGAAAVPTRLMQLDTTKPRSGMSAHGGGCSVASGKDRSTLALPWAALLALAWRRRRSG